MVCNTTQSAFYRVIAEYNDSCVQQEKNRRENNGKTHEDTDEKTREKNLQKTEQKSAGNKYENRCENCPKRNTENCPKNRRNNCSTNFRKSQEKYDRNNPLPDIFSDSDLLLICALIYILYKNGADQKIILALVFVLIS